MSSAQHRHRRRRRSMCTPWLLCALAACGQESSTTGSLEGRVELFDPGGASSPEGLSVDLDGPVVQRLTVDSDGMYVASELLPGVYDISAHLGLWGSDSGVLTQVTVIAGSLATAPTLTLSPAGSVSATLRVIPESQIDLGGFRVQLLGTELTAVSDSDGNFTVRRVPRGTYDLIAERTDIGATRRGGIVVKPFENTELGIIVLDLTDSVQINRHPSFDSGISLLSNATPIDSYVVPLPYVIPIGSVRRFDEVGLTAEASDGDGDLLTWEWSASAGTLTNAISNSPTWRPDEFSGARASLSVTVRDGHGGIARISTSIDILDVQAGSASTDGVFIAHSYRIEGDHWRVDVVPFVPSDDPEPPIHVIDVDSPAEPQPILVGEFVVTQSDGGGYAWTRWATGASGPLALNIPARQLPERAAVAGAGNSLLFLSTSDTGHVQSIDLATLEIEVVASCSQSCDYLAANTTTTAVVGASSMNSTPVQILNAGVVQETVSLRSPTGRGIAVSTDSVTQIVGNSGRDVRNSVGVARAGEGVSTIYEGFYDTVVWAGQGSASGPMVVVTEQDYRALVHPPFLRLVGPGTTQAKQYPHTGSQAWMVDRAFAFIDDIVVLRHVADADWPGPMQQGRSEIARVRLGAFE